LVIWSVAVLPFILNVRAMDGTGVEDEDNLVLNVDREAAEHGARLGRQRSDRVEHE